MLRPRGSGLGHHLVAAGGRKSTDFDENFSAPAMPTSLPARARDDAATVNDDVEDGKRRHEGRTHGPEPVNASARGRRGKG